MPARAFVRDLGAQHQDAVYDAREHELLGAPATRQALAAYHSGPAYLPEAKELSAQEMDAVRRAQPDQFPPIKAPEQALIEAVVEGDLDLARAALDRGANPNVRVPPSSASPLHVAVANDARTSDQGRMVAVLLDSGASPNLPNRAGETPLHHAAEQTNERAVALLVEAGADVSRQDYRGRTPARAADAYALDRRSAASVVATLHRRAISVGKTPYRSPEPARGVSGPSVGIGS